MIEWMRSLDGVEFTALMVIVGIGTMLLLRALLFVVLVVYWAILDDRKNP